MDGSPSPAARLAVRTTFQTREADEKRLAKFRNGAPLDLRREGGPPRLDRNARNGSEEDLTTSTNGSISGGSMSGSIQSLEDNGSNDEFDQKINQYMRDQERAKAAVDSQKGLFKRGIGTRVAETTQTLHRKTSGSSLENEPPLSYPRTWGSRGRVRKSLTERLMSPDTSQEIKDLPGTKPEEGSIDWAGAAADVPLPSVEDGSSAQPTPPQSRPSSAQPVNMSPEKPLWDADLDFTAQSLQISTSPQMKIRKTKLDDVIARELEQTNKRALATSRLEEIRERNSEDRSVSPEAIRNPAKEFKNSALPLNIKNGDGSSALKDTSDLRARIREMSTPRETPRPTPRKRSSGTPSPDPSGREKELPTLPESKETVDGKSVVAEKPERPSLQSRLSGRKSSASSESTATKEPGAEQGRPASTDRTEYIHEKTILEEEGEAIPNTPIIIFKNSEIYKEDQQRPGHKRVDSWDTLNKLARLVSSSPKPPATQDESKPVEDKSKELPAVPIEIKRRSASSTPPKSDVDPEERIAAEASLFDLPDSKSERNSIRAPSPVDDSAPDETPRPKRDPLSFPTPVVTGAFIETPGPVRQPRTVRSSLLSPDLGEEVPDENPKLGIKDVIRGTIAASSYITSSILPGRSEKDSSAVPTTDLTTARPLQNTKAQSRPPIINTAKRASVEEDLRRIQQEAQIDDSTLDDFEELFAADTDDFDLTSTTILEPHIDLERDAKGHPLSTKERERRLEMLSLERMNKNLKTGLLSIRDAKRGIERLEGRVASSPDLLLANAHPHTGASSSGPCLCPVCASSNSPTVYHLSIPLPRLWSWDASKRWGLRLTWLGLFVSLLAAWYVTETVACEYICHPLYASGPVDWHPSDPFWGGALPALANRLSGGTLSLVGRIVRVLLAWVWEVWTANGQGSFAARNGGSGAGAGSGSAAGFMNAHDAGTWADGSMLDDEMI